VVAQLTEAPRGNSRGFVLKAPVFAGFCAIGDRRGALGRAFAEITDGDVAGDFGAVLALCLRDRGESTSAISGGSSDRNCDGFWSLQRSRTQSGWRSSPDLRDDLAGFNTFIEAGVAVA
jgi:hypothetical protein